MNARIAIVLPYRLSARRVSVNSRVFVAGLAFAVLGALSLASPRAETRAPPLALNVALSRVAQVHPQMQRARAEAEVSRQQLETARWGRFPSVSVGASAGEGVSAAGSLRIQQPVYTFGRTAHAIEAAQASLEATTSGIDATRRALLERAAIAHARWLSGIQQVELAGRHVARQQELLEFIARRADGGMAARGDTRLAQGRLEQARARAAALQANVNQARAELESLMMQRIDARPVAAALSPMTFANAEALAHAFVEASPVLERLTGQQRAASAEASLKGADRMPILVARFERAPSLLTNHYDTRTLLAVDYQSGGGLSAQSEYLARLGRVDALRAEIDAQRRELELVASSLWVQRTTLIEQQTAIDALVASSADTVESFLRQFDAGRRSWLDVLNAERELFDARLARAQIDAGLLEVALRIQGGTGALERLSAGQP